MDKLTTGKAVTLLAHAFVNWALCGASMFIGLAVTTEQNAIIIHAIAAPIIAVAVSWVYFKKFNYTTPLQTAITFVAFMILVDVFVVALLIEKSFAMFASPLGTWIPFALNFIATYLTGSYVRGRA